MDLKENLLRPTCMLNQTKTLVPGNNYHKGLLFLLDIICQYHWNRDCDLDQDCWGTYGARFSYDTVNVTSLLIMVNLLPMTIFRYCGISRQESL